MTKEKDTSLRMAALRQNLARKNSIPFNSSTPAEQVKAETPAPVATPVAPADQVKSEAPAPVATPVAPAEQVKVEAPAPVAAPVAHAEQVKVETSAPVVAPTKTNKRVTKINPEKSSATETLVSMQLTYTFNEKNHDAAEKIAGKIGCNTQDIIALIAKDIQLVAIDPSDKASPKRAGLPKRITVKFNQSDIDKLRVEFDPLNVKPDAVLVRNSFLNFVDSVAETVLAELKLKHGI